MRSFEGRGETKEDSGEQRNREREEEHTGIKADLFGAGQRSRERREHGLCTPGGEEQSHSAAGDREQYALGEKLPNDTCAASSQGGANGEFVDAAGRPRKQKVGDVGAGDQ